MKSIQKIFTLFAVCALCISFHSNALAQKKAKKSNLSKEIIGKWTLNDMFAKIDEKKATEEEKNSFKMMEAYMPMIKGQMVGKNTFTFNADGTFKSVSMAKGGEAEEKAGKWTLKDDQLTLTKENGDVDTITATMDGKALNLEGPAKKGSGIIMGMKLIK